MSTTIDPESANFSDAVFELVRRAACELPRDVRSALEAARDNEAPGSTAELVLSLYLKNVDMAKEIWKPACQDTGIPIFYVRLPENLSKRKMIHAFHDVLARATNEQLLRPNAVHPVTGKNSGINVGEGFPGIYFTEWDESTVEIDLMLKGGGQRECGPTVQPPARRTGRRARS